MLIKVFIEQASNYVVEKSVGNLFCTSTVAQGQACRTSPVVGGSLARVPRLARSSEPIVNGRFKVLF